MIHLNIYLKGTFEYLLLYQIYYIYYKYNKQEFRTLSNQNMEQRIFLIWKFDGFLNFTTSFYQDDFHLNFLTQKITIFKSEPVFGWPAQSPMSCKLNAAWKVYSLLSEDLNVNNYLMQTPASAVWEVKSFWLWVFLTRLPDCSTN